jgi:hypothetical protein
VLSRTLSPVRPHIGADRPALEAANEIERLKTALEEARSISPWRELAEAKAALAKYGDMGAFHALRDANARAERAEAALAKKTHDAKFIARGPRPGRRKATECVLRSGPWRRPPPTGKLTTGRLTGRDEGRPVPPSRRRKGEGRQGCSVAKCD